MFKTLEYRSGQLGEFIPSCLRKLLIVLLPVFIVFIIFKKLSLVDHNNGIVGEAKVFLRKLDEELSGSCHKLVLAAVVCIEDNFGSNDVIGAVKTQLLSQIGGRNFETTVCGLGLVVDLRNIDVVVRDVGIRSKQSD